MNLQQPDLVTYDSSFDTRGEEFGFIQVSRFQEGAKFATS
jgi:hypothetical protein